MLIAVCNAGAESTMSAGWLGTQSVFQVIAAVRAAGVPHGDAFAAFALDVMADHGGAQQAAAGAGRGTELVGVVEDGTGTVAGAGRRS